MVNEVEEQRVHVFNAVIEGHPPRSCGECYYMLTHLDVHAGVTGLYDQHEKLVLYGMYDPKVANSGIIRATWDKEQIYNVGQLGHLKGVVVKDGKIIRQAAITTHNLMALRDGRLFIRDEITDERYKSTFGRYLGALPYILRYAKFLFEDERLEELVSKALEQSK